MSLVEVLSPCPMNWRVEPVKAMNWLAEHLLPQYPLGEYKVIEAVADLKKESSRA
jgi:2-oxoglutarate ferredoxin oxidoreductase subunit beta